VKRALMGTLEEISMEYFAAIPRRIHVLRKSQKISVSTTCLRTQNSTWEHRTSWYVCCIFSSNMR